MIPIPSALELKVMAGLGAAVALAIAAVAVVHHIEAAGAAQCQADSKAADLQRQQVQQSTDAAQRLQASYQSGEYELGRQQVQEQLQKARNGIQQDLAAPVACRSTEPLRFGDVPVPAGVLQRLRDAGDGGSAAEPAASQPGR